MTISQLCDGLYEELFAELHSTMGRTSNNIQQAHAAREVCEAYVVKLRKQLEGYVFSDQAEEIQFFKHYKPLFFQHLIYYTKLFDVQIRWPQESIEVQKQFVFSELQNIDKFYNDNREFYGYYRADLVFNDERYFIRGMQMGKVNFDYLCMYADHLFSTSHDRLMAEMMASEKLQEYLLNLLNGLMGEPKRELAMDAGVSTLNWSGTQALLTDLVYALHGSGLINNGLATIQDIRTGLQKLFNKKVNNVYRTWLQSGERKINKTKLIDILKESLERQMNREE